MNALRYIAVKFQLDGLPFGLGTATGIIIGIFLTGTLVGMTGHC